MIVALDLSIDAEFFYWITQHKPERVLYPSSSAAYPISLQSTDYAIALSEGDIDFTKNLGTPDMTYGWSKLTGEFLAQIAAKYYGIRVACIRPFSGYGEDQELAYPVPAIAARAAGREDPFEVWGSGKQGRDFVHIDDVLDFIFILLDKVSDGSAYNIGSGQLTSFLELIELFADIAGYKPAIKPLLDKPVAFIHAMQIWIWLTSFLDGNPKSVCVKEWSVCTKSNLTDSIPVNNTPLIFSHILFAWSHYETNCMLWSRTAV